MKNPIYSLKELCSAIGTAGVGRNRVDRVFDP
jgi:hypothetical protein